MKRYALDALDKPQRASGKIAPAELSAISGLPPSYVSGAPALAPDADGLEWLAEYEGLILRQHVVSLPAFSGCEPANRFMLAPLASGTVLPDELTSAFLVPVRAAMEAVPTLQAREEGSCTDRTCCPLTRGFYMDFSDAEQKPYFTVVRESACEPCGCWPICYTRAQTLGVLDRRGALVARAVEPVAVCKACWTRSYLAVDAEGELLYTLRASDCGSQTGCNFCAPSCLNETYDVDVYGPDGGYLDSMTWVWPGWTCGGPADRSDILMRFPKGSSVTQRAALFSGTLLVEYTSMELKRMQDGNASTGSSGGAGGQQARYAGDGDTGGTVAPTASTMDRSESMREGA